jgi:putative restriction endonuclease
MLRRYESGRPGSVAFSEIAGPLSELLSQFGPPVKQVYPQYPFWRLQQDGIWEIRGASSIPLSVSGDPAKGSLTDSHPGQFVAKFDIALRSETGLIKASRDRIVHDYFDARIAGALENAINRLW